MEPDGLEERVQELEELKAAYLQRLGEHKAEFVKKLDGRVVDVRQRVAQFKSEEAARSGTAASGAASGTARGVASDTASGAVSGAASGAVSGAASSVASSAASGESPRRSARATGGAPGGSASGAVSSAEPSIGSKRKRAAGATASTHSIRRLLEQSLWQGSEGSILCV
mgnify:CR=1 FL=1